MKIRFIFFAVGMSFYCCKSEKKQAPNIVGTWELFSATTIEKDTSFSTFDPSHKMIKIINDSYFTFLNHKLHLDNDSTNSEFTAGGGQYTLVDSIYTENLEYFVDRKWENNKFQFVVTIKEDTLIQKGIEKIEKLGIERTIIEKYKRLKPKSL
ncbi:hypothetical protein EMA8858_01599 [Emticicia aquatica]|uniref:Lipocalin-like domain-containing protein n=1 Tax=Emticicia aquatica TaxID=1681835 RepID=A0ABN8ERF6_9BACT|nr:hypothetical protein [Emticicia aquatica]CAH0995476.1 hypothetical protein EMA8858_01599 [Emticicia aquatica]